MQDRAFSESRMYVGTLLRWEPLLTLKASIRLLRTCVTMGLAHDPSHQSDTDNRVCAARPPNEQLPGNFQSRSAFEACEGFPSAWHAKNVSFYVGDHNGALGNATLSPGQSYPAYNGGVNYPLDVAQNVPGAIYNTESAFEWQDNAAHAPPVPNPPDANRDW